MSWAIGNGRLITAAIAHARGAHAEAVTELRDAIGRFDAGGMALHAAVARHRLGGVLGGTDGRALIGVAAAWFASAGVVDLDAMVRMLAPGFNTPA